MDHAEIRDTLSAYVDGVVSPQEKSLIEEHLETCPECRAAVRELTETVSCLRGLGEEEPPPWLTQRIMARVGEEAVREKSLLRRFFLPLRWKLPLEAAALVFLSVSVYLVYRTVSPEVKIAVPPFAEIQGEAVPRTPPDVAPRYKAEQPPAMAEKQPEMEQQRTVEVTEGVAAHKGGKPSQVPSAGRSAAAPAYESSRVDTSAPFVRPSAPVPAPMPENKTASGQFLREDADPALPGGAKSLGKEEEKGSSSPAMRAKAFAPAVAKEVRLVLVVADMESARREIDGMIGLSGGVTVRTEVRAEGSVQTARVERDRLDEFLERLGRIGEVRRKTPLPATGNGVVDVLITLETANHRGR